MTNPTLARALEAVAQHRGSIGKLPYQNWLQAMADEIERLRDALQKIAAYSPGNFRPLEDEIAIWRLATEALGSPVEPKALTSAQAIVDRVKARGEFMQGPGTHELNKDDVYVQAFLLDGYFTAEELEAFAVVMRSEGEPLEMEQCSHGNLVDECHVNCASCAHWCMLHARLLGPYVGNCSGWKDQSGQSLCACLEFKDDATSGES